MNIKNISEVVGALGVPVNELSKNVLSKPTSELGEGLGNLFWLVFSPIHAARNSLEPRISKFREEIESKVSEIPQERLVEPALNIVGPTLEAAKYHIEDKELRDLFAQLIASSMDSNTQELVHPAFVEIIKQLSPFDALILQILNENKHWPFATIVSYFELDTNVYSRPFSILMEDIMPFKDMNLKNCYMYASAIQNLRRLSLITTNSDKVYRDGDKYNPLMEHRILNEFIEEYSNVEKYPTFSEGSIEYKKGSWDFTTFGKVFIECCFPVEK
ncbi:MULTISPECIES: DUF4393 domain-containing protein [unclassified Paenibacillus]|uniref:DUF4393 domain-containing protein n=1 Tax=unclassified Paenibacillus TaxID=185978 RepID=UPI0024749629|nr:MULTISPECIES: DUF4393 domain-containing protein [unclassified Paenibacillus]MDH6430287.1 hypothetical protein [Paenibacillus sp. PastH-4]MDH6446502.1 hypothetical protein [Paenibacillus sp. PastF-4]MDH6530032.1 hypothetical protein [Paenibacillus sp. PastH-3]